VDFFRASQGCMSREGNSGFFQVMAKAFFKGFLSVKFSFSKYEENICLHKINTKISNFKTQGGQSSPCTTLLTPMSSA